MQRNRKSYFKTNVYKLNYEKILKIHRYSQSYTAKIDEK